MYFIFKNSPYIAIIGDIKQSKKIENRKEIQIKLNNLLNDINKRYNSDIASMFTITLGDEFQGLLYNGTNLINIISDIERKMSPIKIRFGVGIGSITTDIDRNISIGADGPAYYNARKAVDLLKTNEKRKQKNSSNIYVEADEDNEATTIMINTILMLMNVIKESWSDRQREIIMNMMEYQDSQTDVANRLNIKQPAVQKSLANGKYYAYKDAQDTIVKAFQEIRR